MANASHPPEQQLFDILDDGESLDSLTRPASDYELLERFPSFYLPDGSLSGGVAGSNPTGGGSSDGSPTSVAGPSGAEHSQSKLSSRMRPFKTSHKGAQPPEILAKPTVERLFNPEAGIWKPKSAYPARTHSPSSTVTDLSIKPPPSPASWTSVSSHVETSPSILTSQFGTTTSGSFSRFPSSAGLSSSYYLSSTARSSTHSRVPYEDDSPIEPSGPSQALFVVNEDPDSFGPERLQNLSGPSPQPGYSWDSKVALWRAAAEGPILPTERIYPLQFTLEQLFRGGTYTYQITTRLLSGEPKIQKVRIDVKPGWKAGTRIIFPDAGHERAPGVFQTMIFVVKQVHHERFTRHEGGTLVYNTKIDHNDAVLKNGRREPRKVVGLDGKVIKFYPPKGVIYHGQEMVIKGQGMYTRSTSKVVGRGDLIIRWIIKFPDIDIPEVHVEYVDDLGRRVLIDIPEEEFIDIPEGEFIQQ